MKVFTIRVAELWYQDIEVRAESLTQALDKIVHPNRSNYDDKLFIYPPEHDSTIMPDDDHFQWYLIEDDYIKFTPITTLRPELKGI